MRDTLSIQYREYREGFTLPVILIVSIVLMAIGLSLTQSSSSMLDSLNEQYYSRLATEAAEAGAAYANYCLSGNAYQQTWGPASSKPNLTQATDCTGTTLSSAPAYLQNANGVRTSFSVGDLSIRNDGAIIFTAEGIVDRITPSGTVQRSYTSSRNQVVKWKEFTPTVSSSGTYKTCAVVTSELYCWGLNSSPYTGNLGDGTTNDSNTPVKVVQQTGVLAGKVATKVVSAQYHSCALAQGSVYCWGRNTYGQLGDGLIYDNSTVPVRVTGPLSGLTATDISTSGNTSCAIANSKIYCWGSNEKGTVGNNSTSATATPTLVSTTNLGSSYTATKLSTSGSRSYNMCAIVDGKAWCWGNNEAGQVGNGVANSTVVRIPTKVDDTGVLAGKTVTSISQDGFSGGSSNAYTHVCAVASGSVYCWGENSYGQLGRGSPYNTTDSSVPASVSTSGVLSGKTVADVVVGLRHSCALTTVGDVYCWGLNSSGMLGNGNYTTKYTPVSIYRDGDMAGQNVISIGGGANRGCALTDTNQSYCWGLNNQGQLGDGTTNTSNIPVKASFLRPKAPTYIF